MEQSSLTAKETFFELLNLYPSPHNGQPMMLRKVSNDEGVERYDVLFQTDRGLSATSISYLFSYVTVGLFVEYARYCAEAAGVKISFAMDLPRQQHMADLGALRLGKMTIESQNSIPNRELETVLRFRQTSRKKYHQGLRAESIQKLTEWHKTSPIQVLFLGDTEAAETIWLNQRAVFDDMFDTNVREELKKWLRFSHKEKLAKKDGLSYDCMELSGPALRFFVKYYRIIRLPIFAQILRKYYLRTMTDKSTVLYMRAPFATEQNAFDIGTAMLKMWIEVSRQGAYLHPFGTIVSNLEAHRDFLELTHIQEENIDENYVVFICRAGYSDLPVRSERIPSTEHLIKAED